MNFQTARRLPTGFFLLTVTIATTLMASVNSHALGQSGSTNAPTRAQPKRGIVGRQAPRWETSKWIGLPEGKKSLDIKDVKGKVTYLYFFQSWCPGCHSSGFPTLKKLEKQFRGKKDCLLYTSDAADE